MALIQCPECGKEISDKAQACLHCGKPMQKEKEYILDVSLPGSCKAANFFKGIAWFLWIGGVILAIVSSIVSEYGYRTSFKWSNFLTVILSYLLYGGGCYCMATVIDYIYGIYSAIITLRLKHEWTSNKPEYHMSSLSESHTSSNKPKSRMPLISESYMSSSLDRE